MVVYYLGKFIFRIVLPVFAISRQIKQQRDMFMQQQQNANNSHSNYTGQSQEGINYTQDFGQAPSNNPQISKRRFDDEEYIDFEEVKE